MKPDEDEQLENEDGEQEMEKDGSDLDAVKQILQEESGGLEALSQALESIQDPKLKEILQAIQEDENKHHAALQQWIQENGGGDAEVNDPGEDESPESEPDGEELDKDDGDNGSKADLIDQIRAVLEAHDEPENTGELGEGEEEDTEKSDDAEGDDKEEVEDKPDFLKESEEDEEEAEKCVAKSFRVPIIKGDQQVVYGIVSEPDSIDLQGDRLSESEIRKACHKFMQTSQKIGKEHEGPAKADIIESYIAPTDFKCNGQKVRKGSWVLGVKVHDPEIWQAIKKGEITGFSIAGQGERTPF